MTTNVEALIFDIINPLIEDHDKAKLVIEEGKDFMEYNLYLTHNDAGYVIGKRGRIVGTIRNIVYSVRTEHEKRVRLNVFDLDELEG
ncbi:MAG: KH domain-containing protein [Lactobacillales bacterium]|jgi:predicted RNA-binding protein YlqC (UPF0109 family)|nr:KH domain-containing protein [Lactobacillales bacterium]